MTTIDQDEMFTEIDQDLYLAPPAARMARCTAKQAAKIDQCLALIRLLVSYGCPIAEISREAKISERVVNALILQDLEAATSTKSRAADTLRRIGARWIGKAISREQSADFKDLVTAGNMMLQRATETAAASMGLEAQEKSAAEILEAENAGRPSALEDIRRLLGLPDLTSNPPTKDLAQSVDVQSVENGHDGPQPETVDRDPPGGDAGGDDGGGIPMCPGISENFGENLPPEVSDETREIVSAALAAGLIARVILPEEVSSENAPPDKRKDDFEKKASPGTIYVDPQNPV